LVKGLQFVSCMSTRFPQFVFSAICGLKKVVLSLLLLFSVTIFGYELQPGQRIYLRGEPYVISEFLGIGAQAHVYRIQSENNPAIQLAMRSPRFSNGSWLNTKKDAETFYNALSSYDIIHKIDPERKTWKWAPETFEIELSPFTEANDVEKSMGWDQSKKETVVIMPLAAGDLDDPRFYDSNRSLQSKIELISKVYADVAPELKAMIDAKLVHGDIKPENILFDQNERFGLGDFEGTVKQGDHTRIVTYVFRAPENEIFAGPATYADDFFSFGQSLLFLAMTDQQRKFFISSNSTFSGKMKIAQTTIEDLEKEVKNNSAAFSPQASEALAFMKYALEIDPLKRIKKIQLHVNSFKGIASPKGVVTSGFLAAQSISMKTLKVASNLGLTTRWDKPREKNRRRKKLDTTDAKIFFDFNSALSDRRGNIQMLTQFLVEETTLGRDEGITQHMDKIKPHLKNLHLLALFQSATNPMSIGFQGARRVLAIYGEPTPYIRKFAEKRYPGYSYEEITGLYRYRQKPSGNSCSIFYGN
jgi:serine/threonine protein kinase